MNSRGVLMLVILALAHGLSAQAQTLVSIDSPTNGAHFFKAVGMELNIPLQARVTNPQPGNTTVYFYANGIPVGSSGTRNGYSTIWSNVGFGMFTLVAGTSAGLPSSNPVNIYVDAGGVALVSEAAVWKYLDGGLNPGPDWFLPHADLSTWLSGLPQFGFGDNDERTIVNWMDPADGSVFPAYYFRHAFTVTNTAGITNLVARLLRDDGAIVYLNGQELFRDNMPAGPVDYKTYATTGAVDEALFTEHWLNPARLAEGTNYLAVEIHNQGPRSEDVSFDLRLIANLPVSLPRLRLTRSGSDVIASWPRSYTGYRLESATLLGMGSPWHQVTNIATSTTEFHSTNTLTAPARFFRLVLE